MVSPRRRPVTVGSSEPKRSDPDEDIRLPRLWTHLWAPRFSDPSHADSHRGETIQVRSVWEMLLPEAPPQRTCRERACIFNS